MVQNLSQAYFPHQFYQIQPKVNLNFLNNCPEVYHLAIYDYAQWSQSEVEEDHPLFSLDRDSDNMQNANAQFAPSPNNLYLARAYFEDMEDDTIEMIFTLQAPTLNPPTLNLQILEFQDGPAFVEDSTYETMASDEADLWLMNAMHI